MNKKTVAEYHSRTVSDLHASAALVLALYSTFMVCDKPNETILSDEQCTITPHKVQLYLIAMSTGYCFADLYFCLVEIRYSFKEGMDYIIHHVVGIVGAIACLITGRSWVSLSAAQLVSEFSNVFMNFRWRMLKHRLTENPLWLPANFTFMFSYIVCRILFMAILLWRNFEMHQSDYLKNMRSDPPLIYVCALVGNFLQIGLYTIQLYWFKLILGAFFRAVYGDGKTEIKGKDDLVEKTKKVK